jgi:F420-0:gamma-glutamyl ligase
MEWTLAGLFGVSALLLIVSISRNIKTSKAEHKRIDLAHIEVMKEINDIQESIRNIELEMEVVMKEAGVQLSYEKLVFMREILDLYKRNYSIESIAEKKQVTESEIRQLLAPYQSLKAGRGNVAHEI